MTYLEDTRRTRTYHFLDHLNLYRGVSAKHLLKSNCEVREQNPEHLASFP